MSISLTDQSESESASRSASETDSDRSDAESISSSDLSEQSDNPVLPDGPLRLILQMVIANESSAAMRCRLVSRQWNRVALDQLKLHLHYTPIRRQKSAQLRISLSPLITRPRMFLSRHPTIEQLCDSQLLSQVVDLMIFFEGGDFNIQPDLIQLNSLLQRSIDVHLLVKSITTDVGLRRLQFGQLPKMRLVSYSQEELSRLQVNMQVVETIISTAQHLQQLAPMVMSTSTLLDLIDSLQHEENIRQLSVKLGRADNNLVAINSISAQLPNVAQLDLNIDGFTGPCGFLEDFSNLVRLDISPIRAGWIRRLSTIRLSNLTEFGVELQLKDPMPKRKTFQTWLSSMPKLKKLSCVLTFDPLDWSKVTDRAGWICTFSPSTMVSLTIEMSPDCSDGEDWPLNLLASYLDAAALSQVSRVRFDFDVPPGYKNDPKSQFRAKAAETVKQAGFDRQKLKKIIIAGQKKLQLTCSLKKPDGKEAIVDVVVNRY